MDSELIRKIAEEIVNESIVGNYQTYFLIIAISLVAGSISALIFSYFKKRGDHLATKAGFDQILAQLEKTTVLTEGIKSDINAKLMEEASVKDLVREKLELIMSETFELELWLEQSRALAIRGELPDTNSSPISRIEMYQAIYFKNMEVELKSLLSAYYPMIQFILEVASEALNEDRNEPDKFEEIHKPLSLSIVDFRKEIIEKNTSKYGL